MQITLLGTGTPTPSLKRMSSGYLLRIGDDVILLDHGPGCYHRMMETGIAATQVTHLFFGEDLMSIPVAAPRARKLD